MKKILIMVIVVVMITLMCSCGNKAILDPGNFSFKHVHVSDNIEGHCFNISKWWDNDSGIEVRCEDGEGIFCSEGTYQLFESEAACPYCK